MHALQGRDRAPVPQKPTMATVSSPFTGLLPGCRRHTPNKTDVSVLCLHPSPLLEHSTSFPLQPRLSWESHWLRIQPSPCVHCSACLDSGLLQVSTPTPHFERKIHQCQECGQHLADGIRTATTMRTAGSRPTSWVCTRTWSFLVQIWKHPACLVSDLSVVDMASGTLYC